MARPFAEGGVHAIGFASAIGQILQPFDGGDRVFFGPFVADFFDDAGAVGGGGELGGPGGGGFRVTGDVGIGDAVEGGAFGVAGG